MPDIKYGGSTLRLRLSENLVAVPEGRSAPRRPISHYETVLGRGVKESAEDPSAVGKGLGGFHILSIEEAPVNAAEAIRRLVAPSSEAHAVRVYHTGTDDVPFIPTGEIYIEFDGDDIDAANQVLQKHKLAVLKESGPGLVVRLTEGDAVEASALLQGEAVVKVAEPDLATPGQLRGAALELPVVLPDDELLSQQWHLENAGGEVGLVAGADARVVEAWRAAGSLGSTSIAVAVIDDGFDLGHPDLGLPARIDSPFDFTRNSPDVGPAVGDWHGTACAGVAIGRAGGGSVVGAAPNSRFIPIRWGPFINSSQIELWFAHASQSGADVISCSWGVEAAVFALSTRMRNAISDCATMGRNGKGCVICFAAGNDNRDINNPPFSLDGFAIHPDVIAVAACTSVDTRSHYSNFGNEISVCAPSSGAGGKGVLTSDVTGTFVRDGHVFPMGYASGAYAHDFGGTSSSCPLVAGVCALVLSVEPSLTSAEVKSLLEKTARKIGDPSEYDENGHSRLFGYGCVDAAAAVRELLRGNGGEEIV